MLRKGTISFNDALHRVEKCVSDVDDWLVRNKLLLNAQKTESLLVISPKLRHHLPDDITLHIGNALVVPSESVKTLGIDFESSLSMSAYVNSLCRTLNFYLYNISRVRRLLTDEACNHAIRSLVLSRLDYANSLLVNINVTDIERLQRIQNRAARIIFRARKTDCATPLLRDLHWLPVSKRIMFKVALLVYKSMHKLAPQYISDMFSPITQSNYSLRSRMDPLLLKIPCIKSKNVNKALALLAQQFGIPFPLKFVHVLQSIHLRKN